MRKYYRYTRRRIRRQNFKNLIFDTKETPLQKALAVAMGVFIGVIPIWGMQIASALVSAQYLKLNKPLAVIGSYINLTPLFPIIILFSLKIGFAITGNSDIILSLSQISFETAKTYFWMFLIGSIPVAIITAFIFGFLTYIAAKLISNPEVQQSVSKHQTLKQQLA